MFERRVSERVVKNCPVTRASRGVIRIEPGVLAELAGTLEDEVGWEWAVRLHGTRSDDGLEVYVSSISVPRQERHGTEVDVLDEEGTRPKDVVGVLHSHHSMGARFSGTDYRELNPRFQTSIVISSNLHTDEDCWLGFSYQAEGKVKLPCGGTGVVPFSLLPAGVEDWPIECKAELASDAKNDSLGDCVNLEVHSLGRYQAMQYGKCGCTVTEKFSKKAVFGTGTHGVKELLPVPRTVMPVYNGLLKSGLTVVDKRQPALLYEPVDVVEEAYRTAVECEFCGEPEDVKLVQGDLMCYDCRRWYLEDERALNVGGWTVRKDDYEWKGGSLND